MVNKKEFIAVVNNMGATYAKPASRTDIERAEQILNLKFADDYEFYVENFGVLAGVGISITGITKALSLDVITITTNFKKINGKIPSELYVVDIHPDGKYILQNKNGDIYSAYVEDNTAVHEYNSLIEYLKNTYCPTMEEVS